MPTLTPFDTYKEYLAYKNHFSKEKYDYQKYGGKSRAKIDSFYKRKDRYFLEKMSRKYKDPEIRNFFLANFVDTDNPQGLWIGNIIRSGETVYKEWQKRNESLFYHFKQKSEEFLDQYSYDEFFDASNGHPPILKEHLAGNISQEMMCIFQEFIDASDFNFSHWISEVKGRVAKFSKFRHHSDFWTYYYTKICNSNYFHTKEKIQYETIKSYCKSKGVPLILCSINEWSKLNFDYLMKVKRKHRAQHSHPNKEGHRLIAKTILDKI